MKSLAFNRRGTLLAAGCCDGSSVIWDFDTRGVAKELTSEYSSSPITCVSWSKTGHKLLGGAPDRILLWDVVSGKVEITVEFDSPVTGASISPKDSAICLVCFASGSPVLVDLHDGSKKPLLRELCETDSVNRGERSCGGGALPLSKGAEESGTPQAQGRAGKGGNAGGEAHGVSASAATFNKKGDLVYVGNAKGELLLVDVATQSILGVVVVSPGSAIRQVAFDRSGDCLLTNSNDRIIRIFTNLLPSENSAEAAAQIAQAGNAGLTPSAGSPTAGGGNNRASLSKGSGKGGADLDRLGVSSKKHRSPFLRRAKDFQDVVNRCPWKVACFSGDSEYVLGASALKAEHKIHIWNRNFGQLVRILEGPKEGILDLVWHPTRPIVASVATSGVVYLWAKGYIENWSAFAPDFKELEENEEYVEREDEFDQVQEEKLYAEIECVSCVCDRSVGLRMRKVKPAREEEDEEVDILTVEKVPAYSDSDNSQDGLYFLPTVPEPDPPPEGWENLQDGVQEDTKGKAKEKGNETQEDDDDDKEKVVGRARAREMGSGQESRKERRREGRKNTRLSAEHRGAACLAERVKGEVAQTQEAGKEWSAERQGDGAREDDKNLVDTEDQGTNGRGENDASWPTMTEDTDEVDEAAADEEMESGQNAEPGSHQRPKRRRKIPDRLLDSQEGKMLRPINRRKCLGRLRLSAPAGLPRGAHSFRRVVGRGATSRPRGSSHETGQDDPFARASSSDLVGGTTASADDFRTTASQFLHRSPVHVHKDGPLTRQGEHGGAHADGNTFHHWDSPIPVHRRQSPYSI
ncbi:hypothetical protein CBR_g10843 [Chara braunii]|uniref:Uncharacterized protein n=1 Tax=Chara braunii TaxID=69332 RepID=A0A388KPF1_CHABU|nr:hypothetical protein CBR_g10843 [Chara braunii]|eukprot:GBG71907.1 hypothetical protein CBR_g10843 [Chara braunii]